MRQTALLTGILLAGTSAFAADPQLLNLVMPDAKILAGVNATTARISPLGQFLNSKIGLAGQEQQQFIAATGFNPLQDVSEVLVATVADPANPSGLLLARGNFPVDKLVAAVQTNAKGATVETYGGATLISVTDPKQKLTHAVAFFGNSIAAAGDLASVKAAVDRSVHANSIDSALAVKVNYLSANEDEWLVSAASVASLLPANAADAAKGQAAQVLPLLKNIQSFSGGLKLTDSVVLTGEAVTSDPKNAAALDAVIKLGVIVLTSNAPKDPNLTQLLQWLQALQVTENGPAVELALSVPEAQIENLVNTAKPHTKVVAQVHPRHPELHNGN
jgi:hypothetical protein